jgi:hypothetical protein
MLGVDRVEWIKRRSIAMKESKVKEDLEYLLECVKEIFTEMGENKLVQFFFQRKYKKTIN